MARRHGHSTGGVTSPTYKTWCSMKARCLRPSHKDYANYGGRGIAVCVRWMRFDNFLADMGERPAGHTLERVDNAKGYSKANCCWATRSAQQSNRRTPKRWAYQTFDGRSIREWSEIWGVSYITAHKRLTRKTQTFRA